MKKFFVLSFFLCAVVAGTQTLAATNPCDPLALHQQMLQCMKNAQNTEEQDLCRSRKAANETKCRAKSVTWTEPRDPLPEEVLFCTDAYTQYVGTGSTVGVACADPDLRLYRQQRQWWMTEHPELALHTDAEEIWENGLFTMDAKDQSAMYSFGELLTNAERLQLLERYQQLTAAERTTLWQLHNVHLPQLLAGNPIYFAQAVQERVRMQALADRLWTVENKTSGTDRQTLTALREILSSLLSLQESSMVLYDRAEELTALLEKSSGAERSIHIRDLAVVLRAVAEKQGQDRYYKGWYPFADMGLNDWFTPYLAEAYFLGMISGYKDERGRSTGLFGPANPVTECELLKIALETSGLGTSAATPSNPKLAGHWCAGYGARGEELKLSLMTTLNPDKPATRQEVVRTMLEATGLHIDTNWKPHRFTDIESSAGYRPFIVAAEEWGIVAGVDGSNTFAPTAAINRAAMAKIAVNTQELLLQDVDSEEVSAAFLEELVERGVVTYDDL